jgi:hypothetical protein
MYCFDICKAVALAGTAKIWIVEERWSSGVRNWFHADMEERQYLDCDTLRLEILGQGKCHNHYVPLILSVHPGPMGCSQSLVSASNTACRTFWGRCRDIEMLWRLLRSRVQTRRDRPFVRREVRPRYLLSVIIFLYLDLCSFFHYPVSHKTSNLSKAVKPFVLRSHDGDGGESERHP